MCPVRNVTYVSGRSQPPPLLGQVTFAPPRRLSGPETWVTVRTGGRDVCAQITIKHQGRSTMKTHLTVAFSMIIGIAIGAVAVQGLHAQAKPPVYTGSEIQITNNDAYVKEYVPIAQASIRAAGGKDSCCRTGNIA